jgi:phospholipid/cholesterol/gamma-HCH transport system substrate-binding protein
VLHQQHEDLVAMLEGLDKLGVVARRVIDESGDNIVEALHLLRPTLHQLAEAGDSLPRGLMMLASFPFPRQSATLARGNYSNALFHLEFDLNQVVQGLVTGEDTGMLPQLLQLCTVYSPDCEQLQPLAIALCNLTGVALACNAVGQTSAPAQASGAAAQAQASGSDPPASPIGGVTELAPGAGPAPPPPAIFPDLTKELTDLVNGALGGGAR